MDKDFNSLVSALLEKAEDEKWVLIMKEKLRQSVAYKMVYTIKPESDLTEQEIKAIKTEMRPAHAYLKGYTGYDLFGYDEVNIIFDTKKKLEKEIYWYKMGSEAEIKEEIPLPPEAEPHWREFVDEL